MQRVCERIRRSLSGSSSSATSAAWMAFAYCSWPYSWPIRLYCASLGHCDTGHVHRSLLRVRQVPDRQVQGLGNEKRQLDIEIHKAETRARQDGHGGRALRANENVAEEETISIDRIKQRWKAIKADEIAALRTALHKQELHLLKAMEEEEERQGWVGRSVAQERRRRDSEPRVGGRAARMAALTVGLR